MVIRESAGQQDRDVAALRGVREAVEEGIVGGRVGAQQELALRAAARDHVEPSGDDLAGQAHDTSSARSERATVVMWAGSRQEVGQRPTSRNRFGEEPS